MVQYIFSIPTTWDKAVEKMFMALVKDAGFGKEKKHRVEIELNEAEAAAVYSARSPKHHHPVTTEAVSGASTTGPKLEKDDVLLVCDSGGGTTVGICANFLSWSGYSHCYTGHLYSASGFGHVFQG
jgi:hypothetical protein